MFGALVLLGGADSSVIASEGVIFPETVFGPQQSARLSLPRARYAASVSDPAGQGRSEMAWKIPKRLSGDPGEIMAMRIAPLAVQREYPRKWFRQIAADELTRPDRRSSERHASRIGRLPGEVRRP